MIAAVFYFRVFQPGSSYSSIRIDSEEPAADPFELVLVNQNRLNPKLDKLAETEPKISEPVERVVVKVLVKKEVAKPQRRTYTVKSGDSL